MRIILIILFLYLPTSSFASDKINVRADQIVEKNFTSYYQAVGLCREVLSKEYNAKVEGVVDNVFISTNQSVTKGQVIMTIDETIAEATKNKATELYNAAEKNHQRNLSLFKKDILSKEQIDNSQVALENAKLDLALAIKQHQDMIITAPFDGIVGVIHPQIGDNIKLGDYLFTIISPGTKHIIVELPENLYKQITPQSEVFVTDLDGQKISGKIIAISDYLKNNGTLSAKVSFANDAQILHGSYVTVQFGFNHHTGLAANSKGVLKNNTGNFVYKIEEGKAKQIYVTTNSRSDSDIEVASPDLAIGDLIITEGLTKISEGSSIAISPNPN